MTKTVSVCVLAVAFLGLLVYKLHFDKGMSLESASSSEQASIATMNQRQREAQWQEDIRRKEGVIIEGSGEFRTKFDNSIIVENEFLASKEVVQTLRIVFTEMVIALSDKGGYRDLEMVLDGQEVSTWPDIAPSKLIPRMKENDYTFDFEKVDFSRDISISLFSVEQIGDSLDDRESDIWANSNLPVSNESVIAVFSVGVVTADASTRRSIFFGECVGDSVKIYFAFGGYGLGPNETNFRKQNGDEFQP